MEEERASAIEFIVLYFERHLRVLTWLALRKTEKKIVYAEWLLAGISAEFISICLTSYLKRQKKRSSRIAGSSLVKDILSSCLLLAIRAGS